MVQFKMEGLEDTVASLGQLSKGIQRGVLQRVLNEAAEPTADLASRLAPERSGILAFSIAVSPTLTRRQKREGKGSWVETYVGPAGGAGALNYASFVEFGTIDTPAQPFMRPAWGATHGRALVIIQQRLGAEVTKAAGRSARRAARLAAGS